MASHPMMDAAALMALLDFERAAFLAQAERIPRARWGERPTPDRWSVNEIVEHVSRIDIGVCKIVALRSTEPLTATEEQLAAALLTADRAGWIRSRVTRVQAPDRVVPIGTMSADAALAQLANARGALKSTYHASDPALLAGAIHPHPFIGPVTLGGWFELPAHHDARHAQQLAEISDRWAEG